MAAAPADLQRMKAETLESMRSYMLGEAVGEDSDDADPDFDAGYGEAELSACDEILTRFLAATAEHAGAGEAVLREDVRACCEALNALNERCDCALIETDERERLWALMDAAVRVAGWEPDDDVTEDYRDW